MTTFQCNGQTLLQTVVTNARPASSYEFFLILGKNLNFTTPTFITAIVLLVISVILAGVWHYFNQSRCQKFVVLYQSLLTIGVMITYISVVFWYRLPDSDTVCMARVWLTCLGYTLILVAIFERTFHIFRVYGRVYKSSKLVNANLTKLWEIVGGISIIVGTQLAILIAWTVTDPYKSVQVTTSEIDFQVNFSS